MGPRARGTLQYAGGRAQPFRMSAAELRAAMADSGIAPAAPLLAIGILSAPTHIARRTWFRRHIKFPPDVVMRFVVGSSQSMQLSGCESISPASGCREPIVPDDEREADEMGDLLLLDTDDDVRGNPKYYMRQLGTFPSKSLAWFSFAARAYPRAAFIAKADDDSYVGVPATMHLLAKLQQLPGRPKHILVGWLQYSSFMRASGAMGTCGWSPVLRDAARGALDVRSSCYQELLRGATGLNGARLPMKGARTPDESTQPNASLLRELRGPYPFVAGPFELYSGPLARRIYRSRWTSAFATALARHFSDAEEAARASREKRTSIANQRLSHGEDALLGHVVHEHVRRLAGVVFIALNGPAWRRPLVTNMDAVRSLVSKPGEHLVGGLAPTVRDIYRFIALHKFEANGGALREQDLKEDRQDVDLLRRNITPIGHMRAVSLVNTKLKPLIEGISDGRCVSPCISHASPTIHCSRAALTRLTNGLFWQLVGNAPSRRRSGRTLDRGRQWQRRRWHDRAALLRAADAPRRRRLCRAQAPAQPHQIPLRALTTMGRGGRLPPTFARMDFLHCRARRRHCRRSRRRRHAAAAAAAAAARPSAAACACGGGEPGATRPRVALPRRPCFGAGGASPHLYCRPRPHA